MADSATLPVETAAPATRAPSGNLLLDGSSAEDRQAILDMATPIVLRLGDDIVLTGHPVETAIFPLSGVISAINEMSDGRSVEAFMIGREGVSGVDATVIPALAASRQTVQVDGHGLKVPTARLRALAEARPRLRYDLAAYHAGLQRELEQTAACHALHYADQRLAKWLLRVHDRADGDVIRLTQEYMAAMLGSQRTTVNEAAQTLQMRGAVRYARGMLRVLDRRALETAACECYRKAVPRPPVASVFRD